MNLLGFNEAKALGYELRYYASDYSQVTYSRDDILLTVWEATQGLGARLETIHGFLMISTGPFPFPNRNFQKFEAQMIAASNATENALAPFLPQNAIE